MTAAPAILGALAADFVERITACWNRTRADVIEMGKLLLAAKAALPHGAFGEMVRADLPFGERYAQHFMAIARDERLTNPKHTSLLPASAETLYELTKLDDATFARTVERGEIGPSMRRADAVAIVKSHARAQERQAFAERTVDGCDAPDLVALADRGAQFATIVADVPWDYLTYSERGQDRGASRHYQTQNHQDILAMPVERLAARDCTLLFWTSGPFIPQALAIITAWGFEYKTLGFDWLKTHADGSPAMGGGHWTRATNELCFLATRGSPKRLDAGVPQAIVSPRREHSRKPDELHSLVERLVGGPYLELYARRPLAGWTTWGNEIAKADFAEMAWAIEADAPAPLRDARAAPSSGEGEGGEPAWWAEARAMRDAIPKPRLIDIATALGRSMSSVVYALNENGAARTNVRARKQRNKRGAKAAQGKRRKAAKGGG